MKFKLFIHKIIRKIGYDFRKYSSDNFPELKRLKIIKKHDIDLVLDIGASEGHYGKELRDLGYKKRIISFEPLSESYQELNKKSQQDNYWDSYNCALGNEISEVEIGISKHITSSSLLPMTETHVNALSDSEIIAKEKIVVKTLDSFINNGIEVSNKIYMKVDVQGFEMFVLEGAKKVLPQVVAIEVELSLVQLYKGGPLFIDMINHLEKLGFSLASLNHVFLDNTTDLLLQVDGIFLRVRN